MPLPGSAALPAYRGIESSSQSFGRKRRFSLRGLLQLLSAISPKYFYDELGCALYGAICQLPEYYEAFSGLSR